MYTANLTSNDLCMMEQKDGTECHYTDLSQDLADILESIAFPKCWRNDVTGLITVQDDGDYIAVFVTESRTPWASNATYHPLPYYMPSNRSKKNLPIYWEETADLYNRYGN